MAVDESFSKQLRLRSRDDFRQVFDRRQSVADQLLIVYALPNDLSHCRLGLSVSRKVGGAVQRNSWKRRIREAFRKSRHKWTVGLDLIVIPRNPALPLSVEIQGSLERLIPRLQRKLGRESSSRGPRAT